MFRELSEDELQTYLDSGDALDKAGAYGIQGYAARWIPRIEGDYFNVVGLPIAAVVKMLGQCKGHAAQSRSSQLPVPAAGLSVASQPFPQHAT